MAKIFTCLSKKKNKDLGLVSKAKLLKLIESEELEFFSPWRKELRPIRGIYHGVITFYWAFVLFEELLTNNIDKELTSKECEKIKTRLLEEYLMIKSSEKVIHRAYKKKLITKNGLDLCKQVFDSINNFKKFSQYMKDLSDQNRKKIIILTKTLIDSEKKYHQ